VPIAVHIARAAHGLPSVRIIVAGVRKMPTPTTWLTTIAVAVHGPSSAGRCAVNRVRNPLEGNARRQLHGAWPSRSEDTSGGRYRLTKA